MGSKASIINKRGYRKNVLGDTFSLYISNYPIAVEYLKNRIGNTEKVFAELCCGVGITLEFIAGGFREVIGVDIDKKILLCCEKNLKNVGLKEKTTLILGDIHDDEILKQITADIVAYDIPFWFPHKDLKKGDLTEKNPPLRSVVKKIEKFITKDIIIFCPPHTDYDAVKREIGPCEFEKVFINGRHDRNHIYLGGLRKHNGITEVHLTI